MKKIIFFVFTLCSAIIYAQTGGCKDSVFNKDLTQFICKQTLLGDWKADSASAGIGANVDSVFYRKRQDIWTFYPSGDLYINFTDERGRKIRSTSSAIFYKGSMILKNLNVDGLQPLYPEKYNIVRINANRLELMYMYGDKDTVRIILKKVK